MSVYGHDGISVIRVSSLYSTYVVALSQHARTRHFEAIEPVGVSYHMDTCRRVRCRQLLINLATDLENGRLIATHVPQDKPLHRCK